MGLLDALIYGVRDVYNGATLLVRKSQLVFRNGLTASVSGDQIIVDASGGAAAGSDGDVQVNSTGALAGVAPGTSGNVLTSSGSAWGSSAPYQKTKIDGLQKQGASIAMAADDVDWSLGSIYTKTLAMGANTFTFSNVADGLVIIVRVTSDAGGSTLAWPTVKWLGGTVPTQTSTGTDVYTFFRDGSDVYGIPGAAFS